MSEPQVVTDLRRLLDKNGDHGPFSWDGTQVQDRHGTTLLRWDRPEGMHPAVQAAFDWVVDEWNDRTGREHDEMELWADPVEDDSVTAMARVASAGARLLVNGQTYPLKGFTIAYEELTRQAGEMFQAFTRALEPVTVQLKMVVESFSDMLRVMFGTDRADLLLARTPENLTRFACDRLGLTEVDLKVIPFALDLPEFRLWNWRRVAFDWAEFDKWAEARGRGV